MLRYKCEIQPPNRRSDNLLQALAEFRYQLRSFPQFSEQAATSRSPSPAASAPAADRRRPRRFHTTIAYAAERLGLRHHSVVELADRSVAEGLLLRTEDPYDRRRVILAVTKKGRGILHTLSEYHAHELRELGPRLIRSLKHIEDRAGSAIAEAAMKSHSSVLRDFTVDRRVWLLSAVAIVIGTGAAGLAVLLLRCIALCDQPLLLPPLQPRLRLASRQPTRPLDACSSPSSAASSSASWRVTAPTRFAATAFPKPSKPSCSAAQRVEPKIAVLKPISAAIAIGSGGPFGAEGPIIMTGGAFGSLVAQWMHLTDAERTTLLVAGAAAGMSATFAAPIAAILLAVELLLFEWRPRSLVPVAVASVTAAIVRVCWLGAGPLFRMPLCPTPADRLDCGHRARLGILVGLVAAWPQPHHVRLRRPLRPSPAFTGCGGRQSAASASASAASSSRAASASATTTSPNCSTAMHPSTCSSDC